MKKVLAGSLLVALSLSACGAVPDGDASGEGTLPGTSVQIGLATVDSQVAEQARSVLEELETLLPDEQVTVDEPALQERIISLYSMLENQYFSLADLALRLRDYQNDPELQDKLFYYAYTMVADGAEAADIEQVDALGRQLFGVDVSVAPMAASFLETAQQGQYREQGGWGSVVAYQLEETQLEIESGGVVSYTYRLYSAMPDEDRRYLGSYTMRFRQMEEDGESFLRFLVCQQNAPGEAQGTAGGNVAGLAESALSELENWEFSAGRRAESAA